MNLAVIPCLNEERNIERLVAQLLRAGDLTIVIADGGSTDRTAEIAKTLAAQHPNVRYLYNPARLQSAALNLAIATFGAAAEYVIRIDAHAEYPDDYCQALIREADATKASSVVVTMDTKGGTFFQQLVAATTNSRLGNGGSAHRLCVKQGRYVDHGHHALMRVDAFNTVGGYDATFSHNEDAELDTRLRKAGYTIWLTAETSLIYHPRATATGLFRQYIQYGRGRARTTLKHRTRPRLRQMLPLAVAPAAMLALLTPVWCVAALPLLGWAAICLAYGVMLGIKARRPAMMLTGFVAMLIHMAWSIGFWQQCIMQRRA